MVRNKVRAIRNWMSNMGFELIKSHILNGQTTKINHYSLGSFTIYEEISKDVEEGEKPSGKRLRFISWTPWGIEFEVNSVNDLSKAYQDSINYNPEIIFG